MKALVESVLERLRPQLALDGCTVELASVDDGVVRLRFAGGCMGCPLSKLALLAGIEASLREAVPEVMRVEAVR
jgi:Fe-S cluster biogenesis protein NfuA